MKRSRTNSPSGKQDTSQTRLLSIVLVLSALLACVSCSGNEQQPTTNDPAQTSTEEGSSAEVTTEEAAESERARTVVRTDNPDDVKLATDVLMAFVTSDQVDARRFSVTVSDGVAHITPSSDASEAEQSEAAALAQNIEGIESVDVAGAGSPLAIAENSRAVEAAVAEQESPTDDDGPSAEEEQAAAQAVAEPDNSEEQQEMVEVADEDETEEEAPPAAEGNYRSYTIKRGDTLSIIAARELGSGGRWNEVYELNRDVIGSNPDGIRDGMVIRLPTN